MKILVDCGASKNYCKPGTVPGKRIKLNPPNILETIHDTSTIQYRVEGNFLGHPMSFYEVEQLKECQMIIGLQGLRMMNAKINFENDQITYDRVTIKRKDKEIHKMNYTINTNISEKYQKEVKEMISECIADTNLPYNTNVLATIRTETQNPVWTKSYPYPFNLTPFVNKEIENLIHNGIIKRSNSPYNAPVIIVDKKGHDENGEKKHRLVIDFRKLNSITIADRYPIPEISVVLSNLGNAKYFSTIDLESGFHQIKIHPEDTEKTAFSINNSKYEFLRMPFGLKNAPSIFQQALDDILKEFIGKFVHVYIDDILIYSKTEEEHLRHIKLVMNKLKKANMAISSEKSKFFENEVEFLGYIISFGQLKMNPEKIRSIKMYEEPKNLKSLRGFLGLTGYYRKFIKNYADIARPLTEMLRHHNAKKNESAKIKIQLDDVARKAFNQLKMVLQEQIELFQPDYNKKFELTTDASNKALGAVLSQNGRPITFISRTLNSAEENYATNEREMLAIVWALQTLRNYLYGKTDTVIYTDHQPLTFATSEKNPNAKIKRWKAFIEECGVTLKYKPGKENVVADALTRQYCHNTRNSLSTISKANAPINAFKNQIHLMEGTINSNTFENISQKRNRNIIQFKEQKYLEQELEKTLKQNELNVIYMNPLNPNILTALIEVKFPNYKIKYTDKCLIDITEVEMIEQLITLTHKRAHRGWKENKSQIIQTHYFEDMNKKIKQYVKNCSICNACKYNRHPQLEEIGNAPIPSKLGEILHMDVYFINKDRFVTCVDAYSKYLLIKKYSKPIEIIRENLNIFPECRVLMTDNDPIFTSYEIQNYLERKNIQHLKTAVNHSVSNGQIERVHSTLTEIIRCLIKERNLETEEAIFEAANEYNQTIHSVIKAKPAEVFNNSERYQLKDILIKNQEDYLRNLNKTRKQKIVQVNEEIWVKQNRRNKLEDKYKKAKIKEVKGHVIKTDKNKIVHKDNIKCIS